MAALVLIVPGPLATRTGGYIYDRRIAAGLRARGWSVEIRELGDGFPKPTAVALAAAGRVLAAIPDGSTVVVDGLAFGAMPLEVEREAARLRLVALVHMPLATEIGIDRETADRLEASEKRALAAASLVIATGKSTVALLEQYGSACDRVALVEPGTDRAPLARGSGRKTVELVSVAALTPAKGHETLFRALAAVPHRDWHLTCAGSLERHPPTVKRLRELLRADGLDDRVSLAGELDEAGLADCYDRADLFVLATLHETYSMAVAEALARGLPVVSTTTGAIPELVGDDAGLLVPPGDAAALTEALTRAVGDSRLRARLADGARQVRDRLPTWDEAARNIAAALGRIATASAATSASLSDWLALREPADMAARSVTLTRVIADILPRDTPLRILDLGAGTGSNVRYLAPQLPNEQQWLLVDRDPALLAEAAEFFRQDKNPSRALRPLRSIVVETRQMDLGALDQGDIFDGRDLVTASALLDLVSEDWLAALARRCRAAGAAALFALTYDGRSHCLPAEPEDDRIRGLMNRHQRNNDKGFGRAAGPAAVDHAARSFAAAGYQVRRQPTDWVLTPDARELQRHLIEGWARAAREIAPDQSSTIDSWLRRRVAHVEAGRSHVTVGHEDLIAWLPDGVSSTA